MKFHSLKINGLSLIEVMVTMAITSIGLMGLLSLQMQAFRATSDAGNRSQAIWIQNDIINRVKANKIASASYITSSSNTCSPENTGVDEDGKPKAPSSPKVCSNYYNGSILVSSEANCTNEELAAWDLYEITCGSPKNNNTDMGNAIRYLPDAQLTIECIESSCVDGDPLSLTLQWRAKSDVESMTGTGRTANSGLLSIQLEFKP